MLTVFIMASYRVSKNWSDSVCNYCANLSLIFDQGRAFYVSAIGLSCLLIMTSVCPASNGEQAIARVGLQGLQGKDQGLRNR